MTRSVASMVSSASTISLAFVVAAMDGHDAVVWALIELGARQPGDG